MNRDMSFTDHILELRRRMLLVILVVAGLSVAGYFFFPCIFSFIQSYISEDLFVTKIYEGFLTRLRVSILMGLLLTLPYLLFQVLSYVLPGLYRKERLAVFFLLLASFILFLGGGYFSLKLVLPISIDFLKAEEFFPSRLDRIISYDAFVLFFFQFVFAFGVCLQFPIVVLILLYYRVITRKKLVSFFKFFIAAALLVAALLTPPDIISQVLLTAPMIILYLFCIVIARMFRWG